MLAMRTPRALVACLLRGLARFAELLRKHGLGPVHEPNYVT